LSLSTNNIKETHNINSEIFKKLCDKGFVTKISNVTAKVTLNGMAGKFASETTGIINKIVKIDGEYKLDLTIGDGIHRIGLSEVIAIDGMPIKRMLKLV
jgi:hypothetical protein